jgi:hypothetical protein
MQPYRIDLSGIVSSKVVAGQSVCDMSYCIASDDTASASYPRERRLDGLRVLFDFTFLVSHSPKVTVRIEICSLIDRPDGTRQYSNAAGCNSAHCWTASCQLFSLRIRWL